jgi:glycosyltransferase involved in cell wall biosynthesis
MRIALLALLCGPDRGATHDLEPALSCHAQALRARGHSVVMLAPAADGETWRAVAADAEHLVDLPASKLRRWLSTAATGPSDELSHAIERASRGMRALRRRLRESPVDVVEVVGDPLAAGWVALGVQTPVVVRLVAELPSGSPVGVAALRRRLAIAGLRAAADVTFVSHAIRRRLGEQGLTLDGAVIPDPVEIDEGGGDATGARVFVYGELPEVPADSDPLAAEVAAGDLVVFGELPTARPHSAFLRAAARGAVALVPRGHALTEWIHDGHTALTFGSPAELSRQLESLRADAARRAAMGEAARARVVQRHSPVDLAERRLRHYALALGRPAEALLYSPPGDGEFAIDSTNYFDVWWLRGTAETSIRLAREADGTPALLRLPHRELRFVERVLIGTWCEGPRRFDSPDWSRLRELEGRVVEHAERLRHAPSDDAAQGADAAVHLAFPPIDHPMFQSSGECALLDELWRLESHAGLTLWLTAVVHSRKTAALARTHVHVRRLLVLAAQVSPDSATFGILRRLYRDKRLHSALVDDDRAFLARSRAGDGYARGIEQLGLHASLDRAPYPKGRRRAAPADPSAGESADQGAEITVLIPSYRHERFVAAAIESALRQRDVAVAVLVADDRSPDATVEVARRIDDPRLRVIVHDERSGLGRSVEKALAMVTTPFVALLNSDDVFHPDRLAAALGVLRADAAAQLVATRFELIDSEARILDTSNASAVDLGPKALGWIRWFHRIVDTELRDAGSWTELATLLRHNVLATSSNMVMRTGWLAQQIAQARDLRYTLDWQLFLLASAADELRFVDRALLGYRLHDSNTVWFDQNTRTDYVLEVNRVVAKVLAHWLRGAVEREGTDAAARELAALLEGSVDQHGETDGMALFFADLVARVSDGAIDPNAPELTALAKAAERRHTLVQALRQVTVDPWSIPWRIEAGLTSSLERETADGYLARSRILGAENLRHREQIEATREQVLGLHEQLQGLRQQCQTLRERGDALADELAMARLERERASAAAAAALAESEAHRRTEAEAAAAAAAALEARLGEVTRERETLAARLEAQGDAQRAVERRLEALERDQRDSAARYAGRLASLQGDLASLRAEFAAESARAAELTTRLSDAAAALSDLRAEHANLRARAERDALEARIHQSTRDSLANAFAGEHGARRRERANLDARFARLILDRLHLRAPIKTVAGVSRRLGDAMRLTGWDLARTLAESRELRGRISVLVEAESSVDMPPRAFDLADAVRPAAPWLLLDARVHGTEAGWTSAAGHRRIHLVDDAGLARRDERYFARRQPVALDHLRALVRGDLGLLARLVRIARVQKSRGTRLTLVPGLAVMAAAAFATERLCGTPYLLVLGDEDLLARALPEDLESAILSRAAGFVVDSPILAETVDRRVDRGDRPLAIRCFGPTAVARNEVGRAAPADRLVVDCDRDDTAALSELVEGLREAKRRGVAMSLLLPRLPTERRRAAAQCEFAARASAAGLVVRWSDESLPALLAAGAALVVAVHSAPSRGLPRSIAVALALGTSALSIGTVAAATRLELPALVHESSLAKDRIATALARLMTKQRYRQVQHNQTLTTHAFGSPSTGEEFIEFCRGLVSGASAPR